MKSLFALLGMVFLMPAACAEARQSAMRDNYQDPEVVAFISCVSENPEVSPSPCQIRKSKINIPGKNGMTPLSWLLTEGEISSAVMVDIIRMGADPHAGNSTAAGLAIELFPIEYLKALVDAGLDVNDIENEGQDRGWDDSFLFTAVRTGDVSKVQYLLEHGAEVDLRNNKGDTPLLFAAGDHAVQILLLEAGADPKARNSTTGEDICWGIDNLAFNDDLSTYEPDVREQAAANIANRQRFLAMLHERGVRCRSHGAAA